MAIGDGFIGKILIHAFGGILATIFGMIIIISFIYIITMFGVVPFIQSHINIPSWIIDLIDIL